MADAFRMNPIPASGGPGTPMAPPPLPGLGAEPGPSPVAPPPGEAPPAKVELSDEATTSEAPGSPNVPQLLQGLGPGSAPAEAGETRETGKARQVDPLMLQLQELQRLLDQLMRQAQAHLEQGNEPAYNRTVQQIDQVSKKMSDLLGIGGTPGGTSPGTAPPPPGEGVPPGRHHAFPEGPGGFPPTYPRSQRGANEQGTGRQDGASQTGRQDGASESVRPEGAQEVTTPGAPRRPHGLREIQNTFGPPGRNQVRVMMPAGPGGRMVPVTCHRLIAGQMRAAFQEIKDRGLSQHIRSFDGTYNYRAKRGGRSLSVHSWGIAVDLNAGSHPMGRSRQTPGQRQIAAVMARHGFHQLRNDPMHFQYATGY